MANPNDPPAFGPGGPATNEFARALSSIRALEQTVARLAEMYQDVVQRLDRCELVARRVPELERALMAGGALLGASAKAIQTAPVGPSIPTGPATKPETPAAKERAEEPPWMAVMRGKLGLRELPGGQHDPWIVRCHALLGLKDATDESAWCSSGLAGCMLEAGVSLAADTASKRVTPMARSWLKWGQPLKEPRRGCVVVLKRGSSPTAGHVGLFVERKGDQILLLGANQKNAIRMAWYPAKDVLGYRWPA